MLLAAHLALAALYSVLTPPLEGWDEVAHFVTLRHVARPDIYPATAPNGLPSEASQPPLYYLIVGKLSEPFLPSRAWQPELNGAWDPNVTPSKASTHGGANFVVHTPAEAFPWHGVFAFIHVARLWTALLSCGATLFVYLAARLLAPGNRLLPIVAAAVAGFEPTWLQISGAMTNDVLPVVGSAAFIYTAARFARGRDRHVLWLGLAVALSVLTKATALFLIPLALVFVLYQGLREGSLRKTLIWLAELAGTICIMAGWWLRSDGQVSVFFNAVWPRLGPLLAIRTVPLRAILASWDRPHPLIYLAGLLSGALLLVLIARAGGTWRKPLVARGLVLLTLAVAVALFLLPRGHVRGHILAITFIFRTFVATFGPWVIQGPGWLYAVYALLAGSLLAWLVADLLLWKTLPVTRLTLGALAIVAVAAAVLPLGRGVYDHDIFLLAGRHFMPALPALSIILALPVAAAAPAVRRLPGLGLAAGLAVLAAVTPFVSILPAFSPAPPLAGGQLTTVPHNLSVMFGNDFELVGYRVAKQSLKPGDREQVTLYWRDLRATPRNWEVGVHLLERTTQISFADVQNHPEHGLLPTSNWKPGQVIKDSYELRLAPDTPAQSQLILAVAMFKGQQPALTYLQSHVGSSPAGDTYLFGSLRVGGTPPPPQVPLASRQWTLGKLFRLTGSYVGFGARGPASGVRVVLRWQDVRGTSRRYKVFVHLLDSGGHVVAQDDDEPRHDQYPTSFWKPGETVFDTHTITIPSGFRGPLRVEVGMYDPASKKRLLFGGGGSSVIIGGLDVQRAAGWGL
ncbi:MAG: ArnT family glycosyltransferase [Chloroflexota bacterium]